MRMKMVVVGVAAGAVVASALMAAEPPGRAWGRGGARDGVASYLGLTEEQKAQLADAREKERPQMQALFEKMRANREKMRQALEASAPDPAAVGAIAIEGHQLQQEMKAQRDAVEKALRAMLTPEQQTKLDALQALRRGGPGGMGMGPMGPMGRRPFGPPSDGMPGAGPGDEPPQQ
jgi:Spy/CpxP family protein refolding chaperone